MTSPVRVALRNLGCRLNRVELDRIASELEDAGCVLVGEREADAVVINSCAVTGEAEAKCRKAIRHAAALPQEPLVVVCGCLVALSPEVVEGLGERVRVVANKREVAAYVVGELAGAESVVGASASSSSTHSSSVDSSSDSSCTDGKPSEHAGITPTGRTRPGVKIQDGCDNRCSFCVVWKARGASRSVAPEDVIAEVAAEVARGAREVVLSGINLGSYRWDEGRMRLPELLERILDETEVGRLRLSSIEPPDVDRELVRVMAGSGGRIAPFLHMCLQAGSDRTLRRMARVYDTALYRERVELARESLPHLALGCDLIVGFPGETEADFEESYAFCREMAFAHMHVFRYSARPGTPAATMSDQVSPQVKAARSEQMLSLAGRLARDYATSLVGVEDRMLVQERGRAITGGLVDVLVDDSLQVGEFATLTPHGVLVGPTLDAR